MLTQIFKSILLMSAVGSFLSVFWLCITPVTRKIFSPHWQYYIWLTVLIVMILPVRFSIPHHTANVPAAVTKQTENVTAKTPQTTTPTNVFQTSEQTKKTSIPKIDLSQNIFDFSAVPWLWTAIAVLLAKIIKYRLFLRTIHKNSADSENTADVPKHLNVRKTDMIDAPLIVGLFKPTLFLPNTEISESDLNYILMHELTHYRRGDLLYKWFAMMVSSIHWFNPFVYIVLRRIDTECEVSCDFAVTSRLPDNEKTIYMKMILDLLGRSKTGFRPLTTQMASGKKTLKRRFTMIRNKKTTSKFMSVISAVLAVALTAVTVFASGIVQNGIKTVGIKYEVYNGDEKIALKSEPFIDSGEYYLPLRDILNGFGITDIAYENGEITIEFQSDGESAAKKCRIAIGSTMLDLGEPYNYGVVTRYAPVLKNSVTYVPIDFFERLIQSGNISDFKLNVIRPTEPENYYDKNEKVFIGTASEQDSYSGEIVKRIVIDENGETIAVIPIENQTAENMTEKRSSAEIWAGYLTFYDCFYATEKFQSPDKSRYVSSELVFVGEPNPPIAYVSVADIIKYPEIKNEENLKPIIINTYDSPYAYPTDDKTAFETIPNYEDNTELCREKTEQFFAAFEKGDINTMKKYCTDKFANDSFRNDKFLGMQKGKLKTIYSIRVFSNGDYYVHLKMNAENLSNDDNVYYAVFEEQSDGDFLLKAFEKSYSDDREPTAASVRDSQGANGTPEQTTEQFFRLFGGGDFENMKKYCTQNCIDTYFNGDNVFGMKKATLTEMNIEGTNAFVSVDMTPSETSVFDPTAASTSFYVILQKQSDGGYLIDGFATGL